MELNVGLFAGLICKNEDLACHGEKEFTQQFPDGMTIRDLRNMLGIDPAIPLLAMVNNHGEAEDLVLRDGDRVALFPPLGGG